MQQYISTLRKEIASQGVNIVQFQLGHFDYGPAPGENQQVIPSQHPSRAEATSQRLEQTIGARKRHVKGTSLRELHKGVFDAIVRGKGRNGTVFVGQGSRTYDLVGKCIPAGIVSWMMGDGKAPLLDSSKHQNSAAKTAEWEKVEDNEYVYPRSG